MPIHMPKGTLLALAHGLLGWALCAAVMGLGLAYTSFHNALIIHALAAPIIFAAVSAAYFHRLQAWSPLRTAITFVALVVAMDFSVVGLLIQRSLDMFASILGTWLPFVLIFLSTYGTGIALRGEARRTSAHPLGT